jgi:hypothetical protein
MIDKLKAKHSVQILCSQLNVSVSGYLAHRHKPASPRKQEDLHLTIAIKAAHARGQGLLFIEYFRQDSPILTSDLPFMIF